MTRRADSDPYADLAASYAEDTSLARVRSAEAQTQKAPTDGSDGYAYGEDHFIAPEISLFDGFHIDGDRRYEER